MNHAVVGLSWICALLPSGQGSAQAPRPTHEWDFSRSGLLRASGSLRGPGQLLQPPLPEALVFRAREDRFVISNSIHKLRLPRREITIAAWVMVDAPRTWGGLFSALQDNGAFEKGLLLGYRGDKFCFALASQGADDGDGKLTYITGSSAFVPGRFQQVVGSYDGKTMRLYVDGKLEASSTAQQGPILYPRRAVVELGAYHDDDEDFPFRGLLGRVRVYDKALSSEQIQAQRAAAQQRFAWPVPRAGRDYAWRVGRAGLVPYLGGMALSVSGKPSIDVGAVPSLLQFGGAVSYAAELPNWSGQHRSFELTLRLGGGRRRGSVLALGEFEIGVLDGKLRFGVGGKFATIGESLAPFRWRHVLATFDGSLQRVYLDGVLRATARCRQPAKASPARLVIGKGFSGALHRLRVSSEVPDAVEIAARYRQQRAQFPKALRMDVGPYASFLTPQRAEIRWQTDLVGRAWVEVVDVDGKLQRVVVRKVGETSLATVTRLRDGLSYDYRILMEVAGGGQRATQPFRLDTAFAFTDEFKPVTGSSPQLLEQLRVAPVLEAVPRGPGYTVLLGADTGLALALAAATRQQIVVLSPEADKIQALRSTAAEHGLYGVRITAMQASFAELPLGSEFANAVVVATQARVNQAELRRIVRPQGGKVIALDGEVLHRASAVVGAADWTHQYGSGANTASSDDQLVGDELELQWFGRPGPRPMMDRGARSPAPLAAKGRLFIHGDRRLLALDAYNGSMLWAHEIPQLRRVNMPRDCSNLNAFADQLLVAVRDRLWRLDAQTGVLRGTLQIPESLRPSGDPAWGFIHAAADSILGTATTIHATYRGAEGEWYDKPGSEAEAVLGSSMFALHPESGQLIWSYSGSQIVHPTITVDAEAIYFVEDRKPSKASIARGRLVSIDGKHQFLVAIERKTGNKLWERKHDFRKFSQVFYLSLSQGMLVAVGTSGDYHAHGFDASTGQPRWQHSHKVAKTHHGGAMQHPVILNGVVYVEHKALALDTGKLLPGELPTRRGCGTMSASGQTLFFRNYDHTIWNPLTRKVTVLPGIRSGCWLSLIPAGGLLLAPESSSGCSCANPIQTSVAYRPKSR